MHASHNDDHGNRHEHEESKVAEPSSPTEKVRDDEGTEENVAGALATSEVFV